MPVVFPGLHEFLSPIATIIAIVWQILKEFPSSIATIIAAVIVSNKINAWRRQKLIERRLEFYDTTFPRINQIYTYVLRVGGGWYVQSPEEILDTKREVDKQVHIARPLFSHAWYKAYHHFIQACYVEYTGHGQVAKLRVPCRKFADVYNGWNSTWEDRYFNVSDQHLNDIEIKEREKSIGITYEHLVETLRKELELAK